LKGNRTLYFSNRFFTALLGVVLLFTLGYPFPWIFIVARFALVILAATVLIDLLWLFASKGKITVKRKIGIRLSLGDENPVTLQLKSSFPFQLKIEIIDEVPSQFQKRDFYIKSHIGAGKRKNFNYFLKPLSRGEYEFGQTRVIAGTLLGLVQRRFSAGNEQMLPVYPSFISMRKFELMSISNRLEDIGIKRIRKIGQHSEFDQIREYVPGDDSRTLNWKATARKGALMVNQYQDERSQQVISLLDMGRVMEMPFEGMALLDYAINASLVISNTAMLKHDKAGLISFSNQLHSLVPPDRRGGHMQRILETLYNQKTDFSESSYERLYATIHSRIRQRSLLVLYTNFEGLPSLKRQLPYLQKLASKHLLLVVIFENTEVKQLAANNSENLQEVYIHAIARKFIHDKKVMCNELKRYGILSLLTRPEELSVNLINKYLEIKARELI